MLAGLWMWSGSWRNIEELKWRRHERASLCSSHFIKVHSWKVHSWLDPHANSIFLESKNYSKQSKHLGRVVLELTKEHRLAEPRSVQRIRSRPKTIRTRDCCRNFLQGPYLRRERTSLILCMIHFRTTTVEMQGETKKN